MKDIKYYLLYLLLLIPILFYPLGNDQVIYLYAGKIISEGGKIFIDFIDIKPPFFLYYFSLIFKVTSGEPLLVRLFDIFIQLSTIILLHITILRFTKSKSNAIIASILYAVSYTILNYADIMMVESLVSLPLLLLINIFLSHKKHNLRYLIFAGFILGFLVSIKYTFGIILIALFLFELSNSKGQLKRLFIDFSIVLFVMLSLVLLSHLPILINSEQYYAYLETLDFMKMYSSFPPWNSETISFMIKKMTLYFGDFYSLSLSFAFFFSIVRYFRSSSDEKFFKINLYFFIFLLFSVIIEKKMSNFHFSRDLLPLVIISSISINYLYTYLRYNFKYLIFEKKFVLFILFLFSLLLSPFIRYFYNFYKNSLYFTNIEKYKIAYSQENTGAIYLQKEEIAYKMLTKIEKNDIVMIAGIGAFDIIEFLNYPKTNRLPQSCFYYRNGTIENWRKIYNEDLRNANWIIVHKNDYHLTLNAHNFTTWESIQNDKVNLDYINKSFDNFAETLDLIVFKRK